MKDKFTNAYLKLLKEDIEVNSNFNEENEDACMEMVDKLQEVFTISLNDLKTNKFNEQYQNVINLLEENGYLDNKTLLNQLIKWYKMCINNTIEDFGSDEVDLSSIILLKILEDQLN